MDVQGAEKIKSKIPSVITIFIKPENFDQIEKHLSSRGENSKEDINARIGAAKGEIELSKIFDYVITNQEGNIQLVIDKVKDIIEKNLEKYENKKILISPQEFKESLTGLEVANAIQEGINKADSKIKTSLVPVADGGDGTLQTMVDVTEGEIITETVRDPLGGI